MHLSPVLRQADGAQVRLPTFVVDDVLASTASTAASSTGSTGDVSVDGNTPAGIAARVQIAAAKNVANAQNQALATLGTIDTDGSQAALAASQSDESSQGDDNDRELLDPEDKGYPPPSCLDGAELLLDSNTQRKQIMGTEYEKFKDAPMWSGTMAFKDLPAQWQQIILIIEKNHPRGTQERARCMIIWMHTRARRYNNIRRWASVRIRALATGYYTRVYIHTTRTKLLTRENH